MRGWEFQKLCWRMQRELSKNRKPLVLFFGGGYESQILLGVLLKLRKEFLIVHNVMGGIGCKVREVLSFSGQRYLLLRNWKENKDTKVFTSEPFCFEENECGFSEKDYLLIAGFKLSEPYLVKAFYKGVYNSLYCPLLRMCDEDVEQIYQDMKDGEKFGSFMFEHLASDSHHNIVIT